MAPGSDPATLQQGALSLALLEAVSVRHLDDEVIFAVERGHLILLLRADLLDDSQRGLGRGFTRFATAAPDDAFVV
jgi:hypothetical protein